jgi:hypothetical protein
LFLKKLSFLHRVPDASFSADFVKQGHALEAIVERKQRVFGKPFSEGCCHRLDFVSVSESPAGKVGTFWRGAEQVDGQGGGFVEATFELEATALASHQAGGGGSLEQ